MYSHSIVKHYKLQCGDRISREKGMFPWMKVTYVGFHGGKHMVAEKQRGRIRYISLDEFLLWGVCSVANVYRFSGTELDRKNVIPNFNKLVDPQENQPSAAKEVDATLWSIGFLAVLGGLLITD